MPITITTQSLTRAFEFVKTAQAQGSDRYPDVTRFDPGWLYHQLRGNPSRGLAGNGWAPMFILQCRQEPAGPVARTLPGQPALTRKVDRLHRVRRSGPDFRSA